MSSKEDAQLNGTDATEKPSCFVLMPISDPDSYEKGHFKRVYEDIFKPACEIAGYKAIRADEVRQANLIHLDILQKLIESPMALCDLSSRNPNALFELGLRQAFDKPVVLVQELGTPQIFDIAPLRYVEYRRELQYREVLEDQRNIAESIKATQGDYQQGQGVNSIVKLLSLVQPASLPEVQEAHKEPLLQIIRAELSAIRAEFRDALNLHTTSPLSRALTAERRRFLGLTDEERIALKTAMANVANLFRGTTEDIAPYPELRRMLNDTNQLIQNMLWREGNPDMGMARNKNLEKIRSELDTIEREYVARTGDVSDEYIPF